MVNNKERALQALVDAKVEVREVNFPLSITCIPEMITKRTFAKQLYEGPHRFTCRELRDLIYVLPNGDVVRCGLDDHMKNNTICQPQNNYRHLILSRLYGGSFVLLNLCDFISNSSAFRKTSTSPFPCVRHDCPGCLQASVQILSRLYGTLDCLFD